MKYTLDESMKEFSKRKEALKKKKQKRVSNALFSGAGALAVVLMVMLHNIIGPTVLEQGASKYGSLLLAEGAGSYIIVALLALLLGAIFTLAVLYKKGRL